MRRSSSSKSFIIPVKANLKSFKYRNAKLTWDGTTERATNTGKVENGVDEDTAEFIFENIPTHLRGILKIIDGDLALNENKLSENQLKWCRELGIGVDTIDVIVCSINFDANGGYVDETNRNVTSGTAIGTLPVPTNTNSDLNFMGWYTNSVGGQKIDSGRTAVYDVETYYAHWALIANDSTEFNEIMDKVPENQRTEIVVDNNVDANVTTIPSNKEVCIDLNGNELNFDESNGSGHIFYNQGKLEITNGVLNTSANNHSCIENKAGATLIISGTTIIADNKQGIVNNGGTIIIEGENVLISATGSAYAIDNRAGTIIVKSGTIQCKNYHAINVKNGATLIIGDENNIGLTNTPIIEGKTNGVGIDASGTVFFYGGSVRGSSKGFSRETSTNLRLPDNYSITTSSGFTAPNIGATGTRTIKETTLRSTL